MGADLHRRCDPEAGSGRAITGLPALARLTPRPLFLDLADQVSPHLRAGLIKVVLVGGCHEVRLFRQPGLKGHHLMIESGCDGRRHRYQPSPTTILPIVTERNARTRGAVGEHRLAPGVPAHRPLPCAAWLTRGTLAGVSPRAP